MPIVSVINYKGGVGKTTLTANVGAELAYRGKNVLLIDLDPQTSLTFSFVKPDYWEANLANDKTIKEWFEAFERGASFPLESIVMTPKLVSTALSGRGSLSLIPSHLGLINVDLELATQLGGASIAQNKRNYLKVHRRLAEGLEAPFFDDFDVILIDCPPNFNVVTKTALVASDHVLIPAKADYLSTLGIDYLRRSVDELVTDYNSYAESGSDGTARIDPDILGVVFTMIQFYASQPIQSQRPYISQARKLGVHVFGSYFRENKTIFGPASEYGMPVVLGQHPRSGQIVGEIEAVVAEFVKLTGI